MPKLYAHSLASSEVDTWELLADHLASVSNESARFGAVFGCEDIARIAGLLHDIGKASGAFQRYIADSNQREGARGPDHSSAGAQEVGALLVEPFGRLVAFVIAGHHAGLPDGDKLDERLAKALDDYARWRDHVGPLDGPFVPTRRMRTNPEVGFSTSFLTRMLFSCLVDADRLKTAEFYARAKGIWRDPEPITPLAELRDRLRVFMARTGEAARTGVVSGREMRLATLRGEILAHAVAKAELPPGPFTLTVPTGGGKTLASLSFALSHAAHHGLRRVVYVIPFTSIIEQTADAFRRALAPKLREQNASDILEHHVTFDWEAAIKAAASGEDGRGTAPAERLQRATENWDAPIVVTTAVQFYESLFSNRASACRKLHNLADSVIVLDEAQTLPLRILRPCLAALDELTLNYRTSVVVCTATQPAWRKADGKLGERKAGRPTGRVFGLDVSPERELAPDPQRLFADLIRVAVDYRQEPIGDAVIAARFAQQPQMLCIVNSRRHANLLFDAVVDLPGAVHLSTWMCPRHRRLVLEKGRRDLKDGQPVRIVSTSLIEAGVDIDFPEVWRAATGLDSLLQAAGRCNREFGLPAGQLVIFVPADDTPPHDLKQAWQAGRTVLRRHPDPQTLAAITDYFGELYGNAGSDALDASKLPGSDTPYRILTAIRERAEALSFPFATIAQAFKVIEDMMEPVIVPWSSGPGDDKADTLLASIAAKEAPSRADLRELQQYTVSIPKKRRDDWLSRGVLRPVHPALGEALLRFDDLTLYDPRSGLRVNAPDERSSESNVI